MDESKIRTTKTSSISLDNSIPQYSEMSTGKSKHSVESFSEASKQQLQYLIEFKENKTPGQSNTATKDLLRSDQASYSNSISQKSKKSTGKLQHYIVWKIKKRALARYRRSMLLTVRVGLRHRKTELSKPARALLIIVYHKTRQMSRGNLCIGKIAEGTLPSANLIAVVGSKPLWSVPSVDSIPRTESNVKNFLPPLAFSPKI